MVTLHAYVLRELLKTFGLTLVALTVLFTMGGGLYNVVRYEGVSAGDVFGSVPLLIPIVVTLTMPMAALFAATMVYGRLAADNELLACRAAGVNAHRTFLSVILLAVFVSAFTLLFANFVIPGFLQQIEHFARSNVRDLVAQQLQHKGFVHRGRSGEDRHTITAEKVQGVRESALRDKGFEVASGLHYLLITNATFLEVDQSGDLSRFTVAQHVLCAFDTRDDQVAVTFHVRDGHDFQVGKRAVTIRQQQIGPLVIPLRAPARLSTADLRQLLHWRAAPWEAPRLKEEINAFLDEFIRQTFFTGIRDQLLKTKVSTLTGEDGTTYRLRCDDAQIAGNGLALDRGRVEVRKPAETQPTIFEAERIELNASVLPVTLRNDGVDDAAGHRSARRFLLEIRLEQTADQDVLEYNPHSATPNEPRHKPTLSLDLTLIPQDVLTEIAAYTPAVVIDPDAPLPTDQRLADRRIGLQKSARGAERKIKGTIHFRLAYTVSALVTLLMGAALGVIFRGARALAAFGLAMIPFFSVIILMVLGRQLTQDAQTTAIGPLVTWGGLGLVLLADAVMLRVGVRR